MKHPQTCDGTWYVFGDGTEQDPYQVLCPKCEGHTSPFPVWRDLVVKMKLTGFVSYLGERYVLEEVPEVDGSVEQMIENCLNTTDDLVFNDLAEKEEIDKDSVDAMKYALEGLSTGSKPIEFKTETTHGVEPEIEIGVATPVGRPERFLWSVCSNPAQVRLRREITTSLGHYRCVAVERPEGKNPRMMWVRIRKIAETKSDS